MSRKEPIKCPVCGKPSGEGVVHNEDENGTLVLRYECIESDCLSEWLANYRCVSIFDVFDNRTPEEEPEDVWEVPDIAEQSSDDVWDTYRNVSGPPKIEVNI